MNECPRVPFSRPSSFNLRDFPRKTRNLHLEFSFFFFLQSPASRQHVPTCDKVGLPRETGNRDPGERRNKKPTCFLCRDYNMNKIY